MTKTRQLRLSNIDQIRQRMPVFASKTISVVFRNQSVVVGIVNRVNRESFELTNMRLKNMTIQYEEISEIYFDTPD